MLFLYKFLFANRCHFTKIIKKIGLSFYLLYSYVSNLSATLQHIYSFCGIIILDHVVSKAIILQNNAHDRAKSKANYGSNFNRSSTSLGVDEGKVKEHLVEYTEWV